MSEEHPSGRINRRSVLKKAAVAGAVVSYGTSSVAGRENNFTREDAKRAMNDYATPVLSNLNKKGILDEADAAGFTYKRYEDNKLLSSNREGFAIINRSPNDKSEVTNTLVVRKNLQDSHLNVFVDLDSEEAYATILSDSNTSDTQDSKTGNDVRIVREDGVTITTSSTDSATAAGKDCVNHCSNDECSRTWADPFDNYNIKYVYDETAQECVFVDGGCCSGGNPL